MTINNLKPIKGYEGRYSIDCQGNVYSHIKNRYLVPYTNKLGYKSVELYDSKGNMKRNYINKLMKENDL